MIRPTLCILSLAAIGALAFVAPASATGKTKATASKSQQHKAAKHPSSHYLIPSHNHSYDRHDTRSPKWHPTIHEHRHVHD